MGTKAAREGRQLIQWQEEESSLCRAAVVVQSMDLGLRSIHCIKQKMFELGGFYSSEGF